MSVSAIVKAVFVVRPDLGEDRVYWWWEVVVASMVLGQSWEPVKGCRPLFRIVLPVVVVLRARCHRSAPVLVEPGGLRP